MAYSQDYLKAARRHHQAAEELNGTQRWDVSGYLYGVAAECAVKHLMRQSKMRPLPDDQRRDDPFKAHFPELKTLLLNNAQGRWQQALVKLAKDGSFMNNWDTDMRYAPAGDIKKGDVNKWKQGCADVLRKLEES